LIHTEDFWDTHHPKTTPDDCRDQNSTCPVPSPNRPTQSRRMAPRWSLAVLSPGAESTSHNGHGSLRRLLYRHGLRSPRGPMWCYHRAEHGTARLDCGNTTCAPPIPAACHRSAAVSGGFPALCANHYVSPAIPAKPMKSKACRTSRTTSASLLYISSSLRPITDIQCRCDRPQEQANATQSIKANPQPRACRGPVQGSGILRITEAVYFPWEPQRRACSSS